MAILTGAERSQLVVCEVAIERGKSAWIEMGQALRTIRDQRLYRETHDTFEAYCELRWEISARRAYQLIDSSVVAVNVNHGSQTTETTLSHAIAERQVRPLTGLEPEQQREVWNAAVAKAGDQPVTAKIVAEAAGKIIPLQRMVTITIRADSPEVAVDRLIASLEPYHVVKFYSELGYALHLRGMVSNWPEAMREVLNRPKRA